MINLIVLLDPQSKEQVHLPYSKYDLHQQTIDTIASLGQNTPITLASHLNATRDTETQKFILQETLLRTKEKRGHHTNTCT